MGLTELSYWLSWFSYYFIYVTIISIVCTIILSFNVFKYTNKWILFLYFWIHGLSLFGFIVFISAFFGKAWVAAISGTLIYFGSSFIYIAVYDSNVKSPAKYLASLLTTVAVSLGSNNLTMLETNGIGLNMDNISDVYEYYSFTGCLLMMVASFFLFMTLGLYLDNVLPSAYGMRKPWFFCCSRRFWCPNS